MPDIEKSGDRDLRGVSNYVSEAIRYRSRSANLNDEEFRDASRVLYSCFYAPSLEVFRSNREAFTVFVDLVRYDWGIDAAVKTLRDWGSVGVPTSSLAVSALNSCRRAGEYDLSVRILQEFYLADREDFYAASFFAQALSSIGDWDELDRLWEAFEPRLNLSNLNLSHVERWARILVDAGRVEQSAQALSYLPPENRSRELLELRVRSYAESRFSAFPFPSVLINLDEETRKLRIAKDLLSAGGYSPLRFSGVRGSSLPRFALRSASSNRVLESFGAGAIGCALSHIGVWERFLAGTAERCLIIEDDAAPYVHWSLHEDLIEDTSKYDIVWVNERMSSVHVRQSVRQSPLISTWSQLATWPDGRAGWGTDGYLLNRAGAERALTLFEEIGIRGHIDGQLGSYSVDPGTDADNRIRKIVTDFRRALDGREGLSSTCFSIPLIFANHHGSSSTMVIGRDYQ